MITIQYNFAFMATHSKLTIDDDEPAYEERDKSTHTKIRILIMRRESKLRK
jgi:hypothetical protein